MRAWLPAALGDYVWEDTDGDGVQDAAEVGHNDVTINLYKASNLARYYRHHHHRE